MENKYFTPKISDFYVGYELEWKTKHTPGRYPSNPEIHEWQKHILTLSDFSDHDLADEFHNITYDSNEFRTPYLTKRQIEKEGWKVLEEKDLGEFIFYKGGHDILYYTNEHGFCQNEMSIFYNYPDESEAKQVFDGKITNINDFRILMKFLGI